ncbi:esterase-like activity of phytase family protein [Phenylobacterium sp.]|uniref:esterase-like activity of phytase family protein n=1 Tax=Phenylobacterium sp. TaxID=1871053 RepID=UPI00286D45E2|nr:esterase-like activity of phytase family protein [Phenylobacterium sp.]
MTSGFKVERLAWRDHLLAEIPLPRGVLRVTLGLGSGLARGRGDPPGRLWAVGDRGPNLKIKVAVDDYGLDNLKRLLDLDGAKVMPLPDVGPTIAELRVTETAVEFVRAIPLMRSDGRPLSGLPLPGGGEAEMEPTFDLEGRLREADGGADTEGLAVLADGSFWTAEEYGPSLMKVAPDGTVTARWVPEGVTGDCNPPLTAVLPAIATRRRLNRGFESVAASPDGAWLYTAFQSPLAHPDKGAGESARHGRIWKLDAATGTVVGQYLYPFDRPGSFERDTNEGDVKRRDLKVCELTWIGPDRLLVLERISHTAKVYRVDLTGHQTPPVHLDIETRPVLEAMDPDDFAGIGVWPLTKTLIFSTDAAKDVAPDLEGMAVLSDHELILVNDNDFGIEGVETQFFRVTFDEPVLT